VPKHIYAEYYVNERTRAVDARELGWHPFGGYNGGKNVSGLGAFEWSDTQAVLSWVEKLIYAEYCANERTRAVDARNGTLLVDTTAVRTPPDDAGLSGQIPRLFYPG